MVIGVSLVNALSNKKISVVELLIVNGVVSGGVWLLETGRFIERKQAVRLVYDQISMRPELLADLSTRIGVAVSRCDIVEINLLRDTVDIVVYFDAAATAPAATAGWPSPVSPTGEPEPAEAWLRKRAEQGSVWT